MKSIRRIENHYKSENEIFMQLLLFLVLFLWPVHLFEVCWSYCDFITNLPRRDIFSQSDHLRHWNFDRDEKIFAFFTTSGTKIHFRDGKCENIFLFEWKNRGYCYSNESLIYKLFVHNFHNRSCERLIDICEIWVEEFYIYIQIPTNLLTSKWNGKFFRATTWALSESQKY